MAAKKKQGAAAAAPTEQAGKDAAASAAVPAPSPETSVPAADATDAPAAAEAAAADTPAADAELDALNTASAVEQLEQTDPQAAAEVAAVGVDTAATLADEHAGELAFPLRVRVTNNTRMPVQLAVVALYLGAAPSAQTVTVQGRSEYDAMLADLSSLRALNGFDTDAFVVEPLTEEDE